MRAVRAVRVVAVVLLGTAVLAGCTAPDKVQARSETVPPPPAVTVVSPEQWLGRVCEAVTPTAQAATPPPEADPNDPVGSKTAMLGYLGSVGAAMQAGIDGLNEAGPPPVEGRTSSAAALGLLRERLEAVEIQTVALETVPDVATSTILTTLEDIRTQVLLPQPSTLGDLVVPPSLDAQAEAVPQCAALAQAP